MRNLRVCALGAALVSLVAGAPAGAVTVTGHPSDLWSEGVVEVRDSRGEANRLEITYRYRPASLTVRELGDARVVARGSCTARSAREVVCPDDDLRHVSISTAAGDDVVAHRGWLYELEVYVGSGDDSVRLADAKAHIAGGPGRDVLRGARGDDVIYGGRGRDRLYGRRGPDTLAGEGTRSFYGERGPRGPGADDILDGGRGRDFASWSERRTRVNVDLRRDAGGGPGERDALRSIEDASTGGGDDRLVGDAGRNGLFAGAGRDAIRGGAGDDELGPGAEGYAQGVGDSDFDALSCGSGRDRVDVPYGDPLPRGCELISAADSADLDDTWLHVQPRRRANGRLLFEAICPSANCRRRVVLEWRGREIARSRTVEFERRRHWIPLRLPRRLPSGLIRVRLEGEDQGYESPSWFRYRFGYRLRR
jgi:hypothetical protein